MKSAKTLKTSIFVLLFSVLCTSAFLFPAQAGSLWDMQEGTDDLAQAFGEANPDDPLDIRDFTVRAIKIFLSFVGLILVIINIWAGWKWMTAAGNEDRVKEARRQLRNGIIGFLVILAAYIIVDFLVRMMNNEIFNLW